MLPTKGEFHMKFYIHAKDEDDALERAGHGASLEFDSLEKAEEGFDPDEHEGFGIYRVEVTKLMEAWCPRCKSRHDVRVICNAV